MKSTVEHYYEKRKDRNVHFYDVASVGSCAINHGNGNKGDIYDILATVDSVPRYVDACPEDFSAGFQKIPSFFQSAFQKSINQIAYTGFVEEGQKVKLGLNSYESLIKSLLTWDKPSLAGRYQKPMNHLLELSRELQLAKQINYEFAAKIGLILLNRDVDGWSKMRVASMEDFRGLQQEEFLIQMLFEQIAEISYIGDVRKEVKDKANRIGRNNAVWYTKTYMPILENLAKQGIIELHNGVIKRNLSFENIPKLFEQLPMAVKHRLVTTGRGLPIVQEMFTQKVVGALAEMTKSASMGMIFKGALFYPNRVAYLKQKYNRWKQSEK